MSFRRYYKNDWDLQITSDSIPYIIVSNCIGVKGDVSKLINDSISIFKD